MNELHWCWIEQLNFLSIGTELIYFKIQLIDLLLLCLKTKFYELL